MAEGTLEEPRTSVLDRGVDLTAVSWTTIAWIGVVLVAVALRFVHLDIWALAPAEGRRAYDAFVFYRGATSDPGQDIPNTAPLLLLLQSLGFFLFGATDATARIMPALLGVAMVVATIGLRPFVGRPATLGMAAAAALSPTLVYASRTADPQIAVACGALLLVVAFLRLGVPDKTEDYRWKWGLVGGLAIGVMLASSPSSISVLLSLAIGGVVAAIAEPNRSGPVGRSLAVIRATPQVLWFGGGGLLLFLIAAFTRIFSDFAAIRGIGETFADWGRLVTTDSSPTPTQFFLLTILLYEILAVIFAVVAANRSQRSGQPGLHWGFFGAWFGASLLLFSFSSGRSPEHAIQVTLPLILLGGMGLGQAVSDLELANVLRGRGGILAIALVALLIASLALLVLLGRIDSAPDRNQAIFEAAVVGALVVIPLFFAVLALARGEPTTSLHRQPLLIILLTFSIFAAAYTLRSSIMLNFYNADQGIELVAQRTSTAAVRPMVDRLRRLSRDITQAEGSVRDPTGGHGLTIAIDRRVQSPFRWYFRDFPDAAVAPAGQTALSGAQVVIAPDDAGLAEAGYTPQPYNVVNRVPGAYSAPQFSDIARDVFFPSRWIRGSKYLLFRDLETEAAPESVTVGLNQELAAKVFPNTGPFNLFERPGGGTGRGQFNQPRGIAVSPLDGTIYVVDMGNARVERFTDTGEFVGIWGGSEGGEIAFERTAAGLGPTGIAVGPDGLIYVSDTWNHRIVVVDAEGSRVREFGAFADTADAPTAESEPGLFFGPRAVAVSGEEIYVVDTGNERVQVFGMDGTFLRSWGGYGSAPNQLIEPVGIAIDNQGRVYVADSGNGRISVFANSGTPLAQWPVEAWLTRQYFEPYLAFDGAGYLYATSSATASVEVLGPDGTLVESIREVAGEALEEPIGIATGADGSVLIADGTRHAVFRYTPPEAAPVDDIVDELPAAASPVASPLASPEATPQD